MSVPLKKPGYLRIMSFDPSTTNLGVSFIDVCIERTEKFKLLYSNTIFGEKVSYNVPPQFDDRSGTGVLARSYCLSRASAELIQIYEPDTCICEDNYMGVSALTYKQLIQAVSLLREAVNNAGMNLHLSYVFPNLAKAIVGANFRGTTKEDVMKGIQEYPHMDSGNVDLTLLDEHSADSVAIGLYRAEAIAKDYGVMCGEPE